MNLLKRLVQNEVRGIRENDRKWAWQEKPEEAPEAVLWAVLIVGLLLVIFAAEATKYVPQDLLR